MSAATTSSPPRYRVENFPAELVALPRWCVFEVIRGTDGKTKKLPLIAGITGKAHARSNDLRTLRPFDVALADAEARGLHLAFVFDRDLSYFFIDADDVVGPDGAIRPDVAPVVDTLDTYTEYSASGTGLHIIGRGTFPERSANRPAPEGCKLLERYPLHGGRFCIFTGDTLLGLETIEDRAAELAALFPASIQHSNGSTSSAGYQGATGTLTDDEVTAIVDWAKPFWTDGRRHHMALYLSGELGRQRVSREQAAAIIERCAADDSDPGAKLTACHDTYDNIAAGVDTSGWYGLKDTCGLSEAQLAPLSATLQEFWQRSIVTLPLPGSSTRLLVAQKDTSAAMPTPAFPLDALPPTVRAYVTAAAESLNVPPEMVAVPLLGLAGALIGNRLHLVLKNSWREYPTLYLAIVARPGSAKTPALGLAKWPLDALQKAAHERYTERQASYDAALATWKDDGQKRGDAKPEKPQLRHYFSTELPVEALAGMLAGSPGVAIIRDEISGWVAAMDQYRGGRGSDRQQYLSLWSAQTLKVDRKGGGSVYVTNPVACVVGGIQPDLAGTLHDAAKRRDGFVERILPVVPDVEPARWSDATPSTELYRAVLAVFQALDRLDRPDDGHGVNLSPEARALFVAWHDENAALVSAAGGLAGGFYSKLPAHVARFALILHALWNPDDPRPMLNVARMEDAIELGEFFRAHIGRFLVLLNASASDAGAGLATRIQRILRAPDADDEGGWVARAKIYRRLRNVSADELMMALDLLIEAGQIERRIVPSKTKPAEHYRLCQSPSQSHSHSQYSHNPGASGPESASGASERTNTTNNENGESNKNDEWTGGEEGVL